MSYFTFYNYLSCGQQPLWFLALIKCHGEKSTRNIVGWAFFSDVHTTIDKWLEMLSC